jgi:RNA polymerase sigma factor (sigma-70 family)
MVTFPVRFSARRLFFHEVNTRTDQELVREYAERRSEPAFGELVRRHVDLVHSAALRMVGDAHQAQDVSQAVFVALAQNARQLTAHPVLSGWLHRTAQHLAANTVRASVRRQTREQEAVAMNELLATASEPSWETIAPPLDAALGELSEPDRDAVLLRYFEKKSAQEMAGMLGISDEAAQKRVNRAVERLRDYFAKRGVTIGAGGLVVVISANAVTAAPVGLAAAIATAALAGTAVSTATLIAATKTIAMTTLQKTIITTALVAAAGAGVFEARQVAQLREQNQTLQQQQAPLAEQVRQLQGERDQSASQLASLAEKVGKMDQNNLELLKLRGEVTLLHNQQGELEKLRAENLQLRNQRNHATVVPAATASRNQVVGDAAIQLNQCLNNLRQIDAAMQQCALEHRLTATNIITAEQILPYLMNQQLPQCPAGGTYTFGSLNELPVCSIPGHALPAYIGSPSDEQIAGNVISAILRDLNSPNRRNDIAEARTAYQQKHNGQTSGDMSEVILYLKNPGPQLRAALDNYKQMHNGQMPTNVVELAPFFP